MDLLIIAETLITTCTKNAYGDGTIMCQMTWEWHCTCVLLLLLLLLLLIYIYIYIYI